MVPDAFHDYFVASAGVAGALIGLLFVAVSVHPEQVGQESSSAESFRPSAAPSALLNSLLVSLFMLIPDTQVGGGVIVLGVIGLVAVVGLLLGLVPHRRRMAAVNLVRATLLLLVQGSIYVVEVTQGVQLRRGEDGEGPAGTLCIMVLILFAIGIERAWEFVGARMPGLWTVLAAFRENRRP